MIFFNMIRSFLILWFAFIVFGFNYLFSKTSNNKAYQHMQVGAGLVANLDKVEMTGRNKGIQVIRNV